MSGGRTSSRSQTVNSNETDNSNTQINDTEGLVLNFEGAENSEATIIQSDQGSIEQAFALGESALDVNRESLSRSLDTVDKATEGLVDFGSDALDQAFDFGNQAISSSQDFSKDVLSEAQEITSDALAVAGNAQSNAFAKIKDIAGLFDKNTSTLRNIIFALVAIMAVALVFLFVKRRLGL